MKMPSSTSINGHLLNRAVLVLNANYSPMMICTAKRAICMGYLNKVDILANYSDHVHSPSITLDLPSVIKIRDYIKYDNLSVDLNRKNIIVILMSIELILLAVNINLVSFSIYLGDLTGQVFTLFILTVAAAEAAIGLAIIVVYYRNAGTIRVEEIDKLKG